MIEQGDIVGLFFEYGPEKCYYIGLAEYIGREAPPDDLFSKLAKYGTFDGLHVQRGRGLLIEYKKEDQQMRFRLLETDEIVYEQEVWYAPKAMVKQLLDSAKSRHAGELSDIRAICRKTREQDRNLPLVANGFIEIHLSFSNRPLHDISELPEGLSPQEEICDRITMALNDLDFTNEQIDIKVREFEEIRLRSDQKYQDANTYP
jgi:hypothetical protein